MGRDEEKEGKVNSTISDLQETGMSPTVMSQTPKKTFDFYQYKDDVAEDEVIHTGKNEQYSLHQYETSNTDEMKNESLGTRIFTWFKRIQFQLILFIVTMIMMITRSVDFVLLVRMVTKMHNYEVFLTSIALALLFNLIFWPIVWFRMFVTNQVTADMRKFPKWKFLVIGVLDYFSNLLMVVPAAFVPGPVNVVMGNSVILVNMAVAFLVIGSRYNPLHYGGVIIVLVGIIVDVFPLFAGSNTGNVDRFLWLWILLLFLANIPMALSNVLKEIFLKRKNLDIWYVQAWCMLFQFIFGILSFPIVLIPLPPPYLSIQITEIPQNFWYGTKCFFGFNSLPDDKCDYFYLVILVFLSFNLIFNYTMLVVFKAGSSTLAVIGAAGRLALSNIGFLIPFIAGEATSKKLTMFDIEALVIVIVGVVMYSLTKETQATEENDYFFRTRMKILRAVPFLRVLVEDPDDDDKIDPLDGGNQIVEEEEEESNQKLIKY